MRRNVDTNNYGIDRDEDAGTKEVESFRNVEKAGEERAFQGWTPISGGLVVHGLDEVTEFW